MLLRPWPGCYLQGEDCDGEVAYAIHVRPVQPRLFEGNVVECCAACTAWWRSVPGDGILAVWSVHTVQARMTLGGDPR